MAPTLRRLCGSFAAALLLIAHTAALGQPVKQVKLTEKEVQGFIAAQPEMSALAEKMLGAASETPDPKIEAERQSTVRKHGFAGIAEYDLVAANISMVMAGIDPESKEFTDPLLQLKQEIAEVKADKALSAEEKQRTLEELNAELKSTAAIQFPGNVALVKKYYDQLAKIGE